MARLVSQAKAGFYPTPAKVVEDIIKMLHPGDGVKVLDPCCGEGNAMQDIQSAYPSITTYGIELDSSRYEEAKSKIDHCLNCDAIGEAKITNNAFDILLENPPYDFDTKGDELTSLRLEKKFLSNHSRYLKTEGGILIFIIPITVIKDIKPLITKYKDLQILAFPERYYTAFRQVVIIGKSSKFSDRTNFLKNSALIDKIINEVDIDRAYEQLPTTECPITTYTVTRNNYELKSFYTSRINPDEAVEILKQSPLNRTFSSIQKIKTISTINPLTDLTSGHLAMLIAAGMIDGLIIKNSKRLVVKGSVQSKMKTNHVASDETKEVLLKTYQITINVLDLDTGIITRVQ